MLFNTRITDSGIARLCELTDLEVLVVSSPLATSRSFDDVKKLQQLTHIGTWGWKVDPQDLAKLDGIESLGLVTSMTDDALPILAEFSSLKKLTLHGEDVTDDNLHYLHKLPQLEWLNLRNTSVHKNGEAARRLRAALPGCRISLPKTAREKEIERNFNSWRFGIRTPVSQSIAQDFGWSRADSETVEQESAKGTEEG